MGQCFSVLSHSRRENKVMPVANADSNHCLPKCKESVWTNLAARDEPKIPQQVLQVENAAQSSIELVSVGDSEDTECTVETPIPRQDKEEDKKQNFVEKVDNETDNLDTKSFVKVTDTISSPSVISSEKSVAGSGMKVDISKVEVKDINVSGKATVGGTMNTRQTVAEVPQAEVDKTVSSAIQQSSCAPNYARSTATSRVRLVDAVCVQAGEPNVVASQKSTSSSHVDRVAERLPAGVDVDKNVSSTVQQTACTPDHGGSTAKSRAKLVDAVCVKAGKPSVASQNDTSSSHVGASRKGAASGKNRQAADATPKRHNRKNRPWSKKGKQIVYQKEEAIITVSLSQLMKQAKKTTGCRFPKYKDKTSDFNNFDYYENEAYFYIPGMPSTSRANRVLYMTRTDKGVLRLRLENMDESVSLVLALSQ